jgi:hypothetical protein
MRWRAAPDRFLLGARRWITRNQFDPCRKLEDAFRLLETAKPEEFSMSARKGFEFEVRVLFPGGRVGEAQDTSKPRAITHAVARGLGIEVEKSL